MDIRHSTSVDQIPPLSFNEDHRSRKPRTLGLTSMIDFGPDSFGWTGPASLRDYLRCTADYIDYAKIYAMNALSLPEDVLRETIQIYMEADIKPYAGGILFEYAYLKRELDGYIRHLKKLGMPRLEISENYLDFDAAERTHHIETMQKHGFDVIYEFGRKNPTEAFELDQLERIVKINTEMGVEHTIIEQSEIDFVSANNPAILKDITGRDWFRNVFIEADPYTFPKGHTQLLEKFGNGVNLANISADQILRLQGFRYGVGRAVNYAILSRI